MRETPQPPPDRYDTNHKQSDATTDQSNRDASEHQESTATDEERKSKKKKAPPIHPDDRRAINASREAMIVAAIEYAKLGLSVFPTGIDKRPALSSAELAPTRERPTPPDQIRYLFRGPSWTGIGIYLGTASGGVYARDFDDPHAYHEWARLHPDLAAALPTAKTASRGFHVYARWESVKTSIGVDGELRSTGNYVVAPPSWARSKEHLRASQYEWFKAFHAVIARGDPVKSELTTKTKAAWKCSKDVEDSQLWESSLGSDSSKDSDNSEDSECSDSSHGSDGSKDSQDSNHLKHSNHSKDSNSIRLRFGCDPWTLEQAIAKTVVTETHKRDAAILDFARALLRVEGSRQWTNPELIRAFRAWWEPSVAHMADKDYESNLRNFLRTFRGVRVPLEVDPMPLAMMLARRATCPEWAQELQHPDCRLLASLVREVARIKNPFFLSQYLAAKLFERPGTNTGTYWKWLSLFCELGALKLTQAGVNHPGGTANRYQYIASDL